MLLRVRNCASTTAQEGGTTKEHQMQLRQAICVRNGLIITMSPAREITTSAGILQGVTLIKCGVTPMAVTKAGKIAQFLSVRRWKFWISRLIMTILWMMKVNANLLIENPPSSFAICGAFTVEFWVEGFIKFSSFLPRWRERRYLAVCRTFCHQQLHRVHCRDKKWIIHNQISVTLLPNAMDKSLLVVRLKHFKVDTNWEQTNLLD